MKKVLVLLLMMLAVIPMTARKKKVQERQSIVKRVELSAPDARRLEYFYLEGLKQKGQGHMSAAADLFAHCLEIDSTSPEALYEISMVKFYLRQDSLGFDMMRRACELDPENPWYWETLASVYLQTGQEEKAIPVMEQMVKLQKNRSDVLYQLFQIHKRRGGTEKAIDAINQIETIEGRNLEISRQKFALYFDEGKKEKAFEELQSLAMEFPHDMRIPLEQAQAYLNDNQPDAALKCLQQVESNDPANGPLQVMKLAYLEATKQEEKRLHLRDSLLYGPDVASELRVAALGVLSNDLYEDTLRNEKMLAVIDTLMKRPSLEIYRVRAAYLLQSKADPDTIANALRELLRVEPTNTATLNYLFEYYRKKMDFENMAEVCRIGTNSIPDNPAYPFYLGLALGQMKQYDEAVSVFRQALNQSGEDTDSSMKAEIWGLLGDTYHEMNKETEAFAAYDSCLTYQADNAACLNNYAYYLSLRGEQLEKAEQMSYQAVRLDPTNPTYLDTYAWVLFVSGDYSEAKRYIDRVVKPESEDSVLLAAEDLHPEVLEHAGDIYAMNSEMELAMRYWKLAVQKGGESAILSRKIKQKKYIKE